MFRKKICFLAALPLTLLALPKGFDLALGSAKISDATAHSLELIAEDGSIIEWSSFSVGENERVSFTLPHSKDVIVNCVRGVDPSQILGGLNSNGQIVLLNPNGIFFGQNARIDTAGLLASTLDLNRELFASSKKILLKGDSSASIVNEGTILGQRVDLAAFAIEQKGTIQSHEWVGLYGTDDFSTSSPAVLSSESHCVISGSIGCPAGKIHVLADTVDATASALIDVSSSWGGGEIIFGGGKGGIDPSVPNAKWARIDEGARFLANGLGHGSGGSVVVWGTEMAALAGRMEAEGGSEGGDGGFLELSSRDGLYFLGSVSTLAPKGKTGNFLLDPTNISIATTTDVGVAIGPVTTWAVASNPVNIAGNTAASNISMSLAGTNVSINTTTLPDGGQAGNITVTGAITWSSMNTLTLTAANDITISANIQHSVAATGGTVLTINAGRDLAVNGGPVMNSVGSQNSGTVVTAARDLVIQGGNSAARGAQIGFFTPAAGTSTGAIQVTAGRNLSMSPVRNPGPTQIGHGQINFSTVGGIAVATTGADITVNVGGNLLIQGGSAPFGGSESQIGHGAFRLAGGAGSNQDGDILVTTGGSLTLSSISGGGPANIGHGTGQAPGADIPLLSGNIDVQIGTTLSLTSAGPQQSIGHFAQTSAVFGVTNIEGNIQVVAGSDISFQSTGTASHLFIGHNANISTSVGGVVPIQMRVATGRDLTIVNGGAFSVIGSGWRNVFSSDVLINLTLDLEVCRDMTLLSTVVSNRGIGIGNIANGTGAGAASTGALYGSIGGNLTATSNGAAIQITSYGDFNLASLGTQNYTAVNANISIGPRGIFLGNMRIYAGGNLLVTHGLGSVQFPLNPVSVDLRAGGDLQIPSPASVGAGQPISYQAGHTFAVGELWTTNGAAPFAIATVCGQMTNIGSFTLFSNPCANANSSAVQSVCGAVSFNSPSAATLNFLTTGPLTMTGGCTTCSAAPSNVTIGAGGTMNFGAALASVSIGSFQNITQNHTFTTTGPIAISACDNLTVQPGISMATTNPNQPITLTADADNNGVGNLTLQGNLTTSGGAINLFAGPLATGGTSSIIQTGNSLINSAGGNVTAIALLDITFTGTSPTLMTTAGGSVTATANRGTISLDENIVTTGGNGTFTAGLDILINPPGGTSALGGSIATTTGNLSLFANNNIIVNGDPVSLSTTTGNIVVIADVDNTGVGNAVVNRTISSTTGNICVAAGPGTFGCSQANCRAGLISGFPFGTCTVNIAGGAVTSTSGSITLTSAEDIIVNGLSPSVSTAGSIAMTAGLGDLTVLRQVISTGSTLTTFAGNNTILTQTGVLPLIQAAGEIRMLSGLNMTLNPNTAILSTLPGGQVTLVVDNIHFQLPASPAASSGSFTMLAGSSVTSGSPLRIFTAYSQAFGSGTGINFIDPTALLNGQNPYNSPYLYPGATFVDTPYEQWCVLFGCPSNYPFPNLGIPFTLFYKLCLAPIVEQSMVVVTEFLLNLHPYNEFPGWMERFWVEYTKPVEGRLVPSSLDALSNEPYYFRRRQFTILNHPKTYTALTQ